MSKKSEIILLPSLLSFERKLESSDALMYAGNWGEDPVKENDWKMIPINNYLIKMNIQ